MRGLVVDLFAGGGGASTGIEAALGRPVDIAINHDAVALAVHRANHPHTLHLEADIWEVQPLAATRGRPVDLLWLSPDCRDHSNAKGGKPRSPRLRSLAWAAYRWGKAVRPRIIMLENVLEFEGWGPVAADGKRCRLRKGSTFRKFVAMLRNLGYAVDWRMLDASLYGAPTRRRRLFLVARCDGAPIIWPVATHGGARLPLRTAAECIDWSLPCSSIFTRSKPLAEKTLWRIAMGIRRFVMEATVPFIIKVNHGKRDARVSRLDTPLTTVTATQRGHALVAPTLVQTGYGERDGQRPRCLDIGAPLGTVVGGGQKHGLVAAFLNRHFGDPLRSDGAGGAVFGAPLDAPLPTVTARDHHSVTTAAFAPCEAAERVAEVRAFLTAYYGSDGSGGQLLTEPMRTLTAKHRLGLVTVAGFDYQITDIGFRMLEPCELLRAQFGDHAASYDMSAARTKGAKVRLIGNSVCPPVAEQLVAANMRQAARAA